MSPITGPPHDVPQDHPRSHRPSRRGRGSTLSAGSRGFCYRCGAHGHYVNDCTKACNATLVQEKLMKRFQEQSSNY